MYHIQLVRQTRNVSHNYDSYNSDADDRSCDGSINIVQTSMAPVWGRTDRQTVHAGADNTAADLRNKP